MGKGRRNQRNPDYYKVQGGAVEEPAATRAAKRALTTQRTNARTRNPKRAVKATKKTVPTVTRAPEEGAGLFAPESPSKDRRSLLAGAGQIAGRIATFAFGVARAAIDRIRHRRE